MRVVGVRGLAKGDVVWVPGWQVTGAAPVAQCECLFSA